MSWAVLTNLVCGPICQAIRLHCWHGIHSSPTTRVVRFPERPHTQTGTDGENVLTT